MTEVIKFDNHPVGCKYLPPEARKDAQEIMGRVWAEGMSLLGGKTSDSLISTNPNYWKIIVKTVNPSKEKMIDLEVERTIVDDNSHNLFTKEVFSFCTDDGGYVTKTVESMNGEGKMIKIGGLVEVGRAGLIELLETLKLSRRKAEGFI
jgi:hypothetical protein